MGKIEDLQTLKNLFDNNMIDEEEFNSMKYNILNDDDSDQNCNEEGSIIISFTGQWFLFSPKTKIYINDILHSEHPTKQGFSQKVKLQSSTIKIKIGLGFKSTEYLLSDLDVNSNYSFKLIFNDVWGKYDKDYELSKA